MVLEQYARPGDVALRQFFIDLVVVLAYRYLMVPIVLEQRGLIRDAR